MFKLLSNLLPKKIVTPRQPEAAVSTAPVQDNSPTPTVKPAVKSSKTDRKKSQWYTVTGGGFQNRRGKFVRKDGDNLVLVDAKGRQFTTAASLVIAS